VALPHASDVVRIELAIATNNWHLLNHRLRNEEPVKWIAMIGEWEWQCCDYGCMHSVYAQYDESVQRYLLWDELIEGLLKSKFAKTDLNGYLP